VSLLSTEASAYNRRFVDGSAEVAAFRRSMGCQAEAGTAVAAAVVVAYIDPEGDMQR
jgi:hypothetical protein